MCVCMGVLEAPYTLHFVQPFTVVLVRQHYAVWIPIPLAGTLNPKHLALNLEKVFLPDLAPEPSKCAG